MRKVPRLPRDRRQAGDSAVIVEHLTDQEDSTFGGFTGMEI